MKTVIIAIAALALANGATAGTFRTGLVNPTPVPRADAQALGSTMQRYDLPWPGTTDLTVASGTTPVVAVYPSNRVYNASMTAPFCNWALSIKIRHPWVQYMIVGNEPKLGQEADYAAVLKVCSPMLHSRGVFVIGPGLHPMPGKYAQVMLNAIAQQGIGLLDAFDFHPYWFSGMALDTEMVSRVQNTLGRNVQTWITEDGIQSIYSGFNQWYSVNEDDQAKTVSADMHAARCSRVAVWMNFLLTDESDSMGWQSGLLRTNGTRKPAFAAYASSARSSWCPPSRWTPNERLAQRLGETGLWVRNAYEVA